MPQYYTDEQADSSRAALAEMVKLYAERTRINQKLNQLSAVAFPVGTVHTCTQWRYPVEVTVLNSGNGWSDEINVFVRSSTGKEYSVPATQLGLDYREASRLADALGPL